MAQGEFWNEVKFMLQQILSAVTSHYEEAKVSNHQKDYSPQATGNNEEGNGSITEDVCQIKQQHEKVNLREISVLDQRTVLEEDKGEKTAKLTKKSLEDSSKIDQVQKESVDINQIYKMVLEDMKDDSMFRDIAGNGKGGTREGIT